MNLRPLETMILTAATAALPLLVDTHVCSSSIAADVGVILASIATGLHLPTVANAVVKKKSTSSSS